MKEKIKKLLFEYSKNSRITTKELGKKIRASQQSASYLLNTLKKKKLIEKEVTIVDAVKLGYVNVLVGFNYIKVDASLRKQIISELKEIRIIVAIEEGKEGVDLLVEYSTKNLAAFNKAHMELIQRFDKRLKTAFVFPLIIKYEYPKNYLIKNLIIKTVVLSGDRAVEELSDKELIILDELVKCPCERLVGISEEKGIPIKTVIKIKKSLEKRYIIKGYGTILNNSKLGIHRQIIFLRFLSEGVKEIEKFKEYARHHKNIVQFMKVIGASQVGIIVEDLKDINIINKIRSNFLIESYLLIKSNKIHQKKYLP